MGALVILLRAQHEVALQRLGSNVARFDVQFLRLEGGLRGVVLQQLACLRHCCWPIEGCQRLSRRKSCLIVDRLVFFFVVVFWVEVYLGKVLQSIEHFVFALALGLIPETLHAHGSDQLVELAKYRLQVLPRL